MEDTDNVYSERTLRYGRNINFISFITLGMILSKAVLTNTNLFGTTTSEQNIWLILFILIFYHFVTFQYIGWIDWKHWKRGLKFFSGKNNQAYGGSDSIGLTEQLSKSFYCSLFIYKKKVAGIFLKKEHKAVALYDHVSGDIYAWKIVYEDVGEPNAGGSITIQKEEFEKYRLNYWRWLFLEIGFPTAIGLFALYLLVGKIVGI